MEKEIDELNKYLVETVNGKIKWGASYNEDGEIESYSCYSIDADTLGLTLIVRNSNFELYIFKVDGRIKRYIDGIWEYASVEEKEYIEYLKSQSTKEEIEIIKALAKAIEVILVLPELKKTAQNGTWEDDEVNLEQMLKLVEGTIDGIFIWEEKECQNNVLNITHRLFNGYDFQIENLRMFQSTTYDDGDKYINTFYDFYKPTLFGLEHCCILLIEDIEKNYVYFKEVIYLREFRYARALYTLSKVILECDKLCMQKDDNRKFGYLLIQILEYAQSKGNVLSFDDINRFMNGYDIGAVECDRLFIALDKNNVDIYEGQYVCSVNEDIKQQGRKRKYESEAERLAAKKTSKEKYRKKLNIVNEYSMKKTILASERDQYEYLYEDKEDIIKIIEKQRLGNRRKLDDTY